MTPMDRTTGPPCFPQRKPRCARGQTLPCCPLPLGCFMTVTPVPGLTTVTGLMSRVWNQSRPRSWPYGGTAAGLKKNLGLVLIDDHCRCACELITTEHSRVHKSTHSVRNSDCAAFTTTRIRSCRAMASCRAMRNQMQSRLPRPAVVVWQQVPTIPEQSPLSVIATMASTVHSSTRLTPRSFISALLRARRAVPSSVPLVVYASGWRLRADRVLWNLG